MNKIIAIDCDGVLLNWEQSFDEWMEFQGFPKHASDHYESEYELSHEQRSM